MCVLFFTHNISKRSRMTSNRDRGISTEIKQFKTTKYYNYSKQIGLVLEGERFEISEDL